MRKASTGTPRVKRVYCEDFSPTYNSIRNSKHHGKSVIIRGISYIRIGDNMVLNEKTNLIESYVES